MNYLAHLFLAQPTPDSMVGNLMPDFTKKPLEYDLSKKVINGMENHKLVDKFTDNHIIVTELRKLIDPARRRFAGIILDVCFDYFLSKHWSLYAITEHQQFIAQCYHNLLAYTGNMPKNMRQTIHNIVTYDILTSYQTQQGVAQALNRISQRIKRKNNLMDAAIDFKTHYLAFDTAFQAFFPELIQHIKQKQIETVKVAFTL